MATRTYMDADDPMLLAMTPIMLLLSEGNKSYVSIRPKAHSPSWRIVLDLIQDGKHLPMVSNALQ